jgi:hypothetical protein
MSLERHPGCPSPQPSPRKRGEGVDRACGTVEHQIYETRGHQAPENAGALFQVASQFNLLEMVSPTVTPEDGVTRYQHDRTPRPAPHPSRLARFAHSRLRTTARCTIAGGAATIYRNYFAPVGGGSRSPDCTLLRNPGSTDQCFSFSEMTGAANLQLRAAWSC